MNSKYMKVYTRQADKDCYPGGLAHSIHLAYCIDGELFYPLNKNYGILFAKAEIRPDDTLFPKGVKNPKMMAIGNGEFGIVAERVNEDGNVDESCKGKVLLWKTKDFIDFTDEEMVSVTEVAMEKFHDTIEVDSDILDRAVQYWSTVSCVNVQVPGDIEVESSQELQKVQATVVYTDGSTASKKIAWETEQIDFAKPGIYDVKGKVMNRKYTFPLAEGYGDPVLFYWEGKWYYISTNDNLDDIGLYVREADTVEELFVDGVIEHLILGLDERRELIQTFWAPEFHVIGGELYILFAVSGKVWGPQCHLMRLKKGHSIINADSWEDPIRVKRQDGSWLTEDGITLDMTFIRTEEKSYMVWSYRKHIMTPLDTGSMLYIATVDEKEPWRLTSEPVLLSRPLYGWENVDGTINNEGPYAFIKDGKVYLAYSGGSANAYTYAVGLLTASTKDNLLDVSVWKKRSTPALSFYSVEGEYGPGHNSFYINEEGDLMIAYHGETRVDGHLRCDGIRRVHFRIDGSPYFGMSAEEDLSETLSIIQARVKVR